MAPEVKQQQETPIENNKSVSDLLAEIAKDKRIDGKDLEQLNQLSTKFEQDKQNVHNETKNELKIALEWILKDWFSVKNEWDYNSLSKILKILWHHDIPSFKDVYANIPEKNRDVFSFVIQWDKLLMYVKESYMNKITVNTDEFWYIDLKTGNMYKDTNISEFYIWFDDNLSNNNKFNYKAAPAADKAAPAADKAAPAADKAAPAADKAKSKFDLASVKVENDTKLKDKIYKVDTTLLNVRNSDWKITWKLNKWEEIKLTWNKKWDFVETDKGYVSLKYLKEKAIPESKPASTTPAAWKDTAPGLSSTPTEDKEVSTIKYKLESPDVIKTAIASLDHNWVNSINQEQIIGSYVDSEWKEQKIVLKWSSTNLRVELDWSWTLDDTDLPVEKSDFESIKKAVTTLIEQYKKEVSSKKWKSKDTKWERVQETVNENEKKVDTFIKLDWKSANIMLFRYANQNNWDSINDKPYRYTVELDKSDKFIDPSIDFDHEPTADELKTAISKLTTEYETYKTQEKQKETKSNESEAKSKLEKENQGKITEITKSVEELKLKPSDIAPQWVNMDQWSQWIKEFSNTNEIMLNVTSIDLSKWTINFDFDDSSINEKFNTNLSISWVIKDGKLDVAAFKKAIPEQVTNAIKSMVKQQTEVKK